jgi:hypothetical protein
MYCNMPMLVNSLPQLTHLDLSYSWVTASHLEALSRLSGLQQLQLTGCNLNPGDLQAVEQLPCTSLGVQIRNNAPAGAIPQIQAYLTSDAAQELEHLDIEYGGSGISAADAASLLLPLASLAAAEPSSRSIVAADADADTSTVDAAVTATTAISAGDSSDYYKGPVPAAPEAAAAPAAASTGKLSSLSLQGNFGFCANLHLLTGLHHLTKLNFTVGTLEERDFSQLTSLSRLRELTITASERHFTPEEVDVARGVVAALPHLTEFALMGSSPEPQ